MFGIASAGGGVRIAAVSRAIIELEAARGLVNPIPTVDRERWRGVVSVRTNF